jgi:PAS domain S-box-containing protein
MIMIKKANTLPSIETTLQPILNALPFYVLLVDSDHMVVAANNAVQRDLGLDPAELIGSHCPVAVHGCLEPVAACPLSKALETGEPVEQELFDAHSSRWLQSSVFPTELTSAESRQIFLHFARDITEFKKNETELSRSLEHHRALCDLLQKLQYCQSSAQMMEVLIDVVISLSWLGMSATAVGFLAGENSLEMKVQRNLTPEQIECCHSLKLGECLCGKVAESGSKLICNSSASLHTIQYDGMIQHNHAVLPIIQEGRVLGVFNLYLNPGDELDDFRIRFLETAAAATAAAMIGQLAQEEARKTQEKCISQLISSQEDERKRVAQDLQEHVCQSLSAFLLEVQLQTGENKNLKHIRNICEIRIKSLIDEIRQMAGQLRPTILDDYGLDSALSRLLKELSTHTELTIDYQFVSSPEHEERLPGPVEVCLYRLAIEAVNNVLVHAGASRISVVVVRQQEKVMLLIEDDGCGFDYPAIRKNVDRCPGLIGMEKRLALLGGVLKIESVPKKGTVVRAEIALDTLKV